MGELVRELLREGGSVMTRGLGGRGALWETSPLSVGGGLPGWRGYGGGFATEKVVICEESESESRSSLLWDGCVASIGR